MANNRESIACSNNCAFDHYVKSNCFSSYSDAHIATMRNALLNEQLREKYKDALAQLLGTKEFIDAFDRSFKEDTGNSLEESSIDDILDYLVGEGTNTFIGKYNDICSKDSSPIFKKYEHRQIKAYAKVLLGLEQAMNYNDRIDNATKMLGDKSEDINTMISAYKVFSKSIPAEHRQEVIGQIVSEIIMIVDNLQELKPNLSREDLLNGTFKFKIEENGKIIKKRMPTLSYVFYQAAINFRGYYEDGKQDGSLNSEGKALYETILNNDNVWKSLIVMAKGLLYDVDHIKFNLNEGFVIDEDPNEENAENPDGEYQSAEETGPEHWQLKSDTISAFDSMSKEVKSVLYKLTTGKIGILGLPKLCDAMTLHQNLMKLRLDSFCTNSDEFITCLRAVGTSWGEELADILEEDPYKRSAVFTQYKKNHTTYSYHSLTRKWVDGGWKTLLYREKSGLSKALLVNVYKSGYSDIDVNNTRCIFDTNGNIDPTSGVYKTFKNTLTIGDVDSADSIWDDTDKIYNASKIFSADSEIESKREFINFINDSFNLHMKEDDKNIVLNNATEYRNFCLNLHSILNKLFKPNGARYVNIEGLLDNSNTKKAYRNFLAAARHSISIVDATSTIEPTFRYNKGSYMANTIANALGDTLERIGKAVVESINAKSTERLKEFLRDNYLDKCPIYATKVGDEYEIHNYWLEQMYNATLEDLQNPESWINRFINDTTRGLGTKDRPFENFVETNNYLYTLGEYLVKYTETEGKIGVVPLFVTGDSNASRFLDVPILEASEVEERMLDVAKSELKRMAMFKEIEKFCTDNNYQLSDAISKNKNKFTLLKFLNDINDFGALGNSSVLDYYQKIQKAKAEAIDNNTRLEAENKESEFDRILIEAIKEGLHKSYDKFCDELESREILLKDADDKAWLNAEKLYVNDSRTSNISFYDKPGSRYEGKVYEYFLNQKFHNMQQFQFFTVDPGFYDGTNDMQKRYKELIASGEVLDLTAIDPTTGKKVDDNNGCENTIYLQEQKLNSNEGDQEDKDFMAALEKNKPGSSANYTSNTLTDGQGYRSFNSYRKLMIMRGLWTKEAEQVFQIIKEARKAWRTNPNISEEARKGIPVLTPAQLDKIHRLNVVFQPLKPFYFGYEYIEGAMIPVQHKYSELPIIPELMVGVNPKLANLGWAMETHKDAHGNIAPIDLACFTSVVKVGCFGGVDIRSCENLNQLNDVFSSAYIHKLPLNGWRQQSNVPNHSDCSRARGTQLMKHGYGCIDKNKTYIYSFLAPFAGQSIKITEDVSIEVGDKGSITGNQLMHLYNALGSVGYINSSIKLMQKFDSPQKLSEILCEMALMDSRSPQDTVLSYELDENGEFIMSPSEGQRAFDNMASLLSKLRKEVNKQRMKGGSMVQASAYGMDDVLKIHVNKGKDNIIYADCARTFDYSITDHKGRQIKLDYFDFVDPKTGMLLGVGENKNKGVEPADANPEEGKYYGWNTKLGVMYPGILDNIAYRIPTELDYSIINLKAKRFFHPAQGGIIMVPSQFTTIAGFDFKQYWSH